MSSRRTPIDYPRFGPRVVFKPGASGAWLFAETLERLAPAIAVAARTAPTLRGNEIVIVEGWRPGSTRRASYHPKHAAIDIRAVDSRGRFGAVHGLTRAEKIRTAVAWAARIRLELPLYFDIVYGDASHIDHIHIECDLTKRSRARYRAHTTNLSHPG